MLVGDGTDMSERKEALAAFENRGTELVAAPRLLDEGVDVPAADLAIVPGPNLKEVTGVTGGLSPTRTNRLG